MIEYERKIVTPDIARQYLECAAQNRSVSMATVNMYADDMKKQRWFDNGVPIVFKVLTNGTILLVDGQHRLHAIVKSGLSLEMTICYVDEENAKAYDLQRSRSARDIAIIENYDPAFRETSIIGAVNLILKISKSTNKPSKFDVIETMKLLKEPIEYVYYKYFVRVQNSVRVLSRSPVLSAIIVAYENGYNSDKLLDFCDVLRSGYIIKEIDKTPVKLRDMLLQLKSATGYSAQKYVYNITLNALYNYEQGKIMMRIPPTENRYELPKCIEEV